MLTKQDNYLVFKSTYAEFCDLLEGHANPKQTKEEVAKEYDEKTDAMLSKYQRRGKA